MMKKAFLASVLSAGVAMGAQAFEPLLGDPDAGRAKSATCVACHAEDGNSPSPAFPKLAGQGQRYLIKQMQDIRSGARPVPTMAGQLDNMSDQDLADIAAWYSTQTMTIGQADPDLVELGRDIYRGGVREKGIPSCAACHSPSGIGNSLAGYPRLAGQFAQYTADQLRAYRAAADGDEGRDNDGDDTQIMRSIAYRMSDREIRAVSSFIEGLYE